MNISKLIITPWVTGGTVQRFDKPANQVASILVKERLSIAGPDTQKNGSSF